MSIHTIPMVCARELVRAGLITALIAGAIGAGMAQTASAAVSTITVTMDLGRYSTVGHLAAGPFAGVSSGRVVMRVGDALVFVNADTRHHTATGLGELDTFPQDPRWTDTALRAGGSIGPGAWSTGDLAPGARSAPITASRPGTYLWGCFFDYSAGMRGEIVVQP